MLLPAVLYYRHETIGEARVTRIITWPGDLPRARLPAGCVLILLLGMGCAAPTNRSFPVSVLDAQRVLGAMRTEPKPLARPLVVLGGFGDPGFAAGNLRAEFHKLTGDERVIGVAFLFCGDFDKCREHVIKAVDQAFPTDDPEFTTEVDVVAVSMGGLVARYAAVAAPPMPSARTDQAAANSRRLRIARLFTISTPHRGAAWAILPALSRLHSDMRPNSAFLRGLTAAESTGGGYEIYPYVRLGDTIVGAPNAAPHGQQPWWVPGEVLQAPHLMAMLDARIIADVARRLRGEEPFTSYPRQPLPGDDDGGAPLAPSDPDAAAGVSPAPGTTFATR